MQKRPIDEVQTLLVPAVNLPVTPVPYILGKYEPEPQDNATVPTERLPAVLMAQPDYSPVTDSEAMLYLDRVRAELLAGPPSRSRFCKWLLPCIFGASFVLCVVIALFVSHWLAAAGK